MKRASPSPSESRVPDSAVSLRRYRSEDLTALIHLDALCFDELFRFSRNAMRKYAEAGNASTTIAEVAGVLVGFAIVHREYADREKIAYLTTLDVHPEFRRRGIAQALLEDANRRAFQQHCVAMRLHVFRANTGAVAFYEREGFVRLGSVAHFYGQHLHAYVYQKPILTDVALPSANLARSNRAS